MKHMSWRLCGLWLAALLMAALPLMGCGEDDATGVEDGDGSADGDAPLTCIGPDDCPAGMLCSAWGVCVESGTGVDGDEDVRPTRILRSVPGASVDFGRVELATMPEATVTFYNDGNTVLHLFDANWLEPTSNNPFTLMDYIQASIQPGQNFAFKIRFIPQDIGEVVGKLRINNNSDNSPQLDLDIFANVVLQSGDAEIGASPEMVTFADHPLGRLPAQATLRIGNAGSGASQIFLTRVYLASLGESPYTLGSEQDPSETRPVAIGAGQSYPFRMLFAPVQVGDFTDTVIVEYHTSTNETMQVFEVPVSGRAINGIIALQPSLLEFGPVTLGRTQGMDLRIINNNLDDTVRINSVQVRMKDGSNWREFFELTNPPAQLDLPPAQRHDFVLSFTPTREMSYNADLVISTNYEGQTFYFPIVASGSAANQKPIARIAQRAHGPDIVQPIDVPLSTPLEFYGDISYDPDGDSSALTYSWSLTKPAGSTAVIAPNHTSPVVNVLFDVGGTYMLTLVVTDAEGAQSNPKSITVITTAGLSIVTVEAVSSGISGESDVDLTWILPIGTSCNENNVAQNGYCMVPDGWGSVRVEGCSQASVCTTERVTHAHPLDGRYQIRIHFAEDCSTSFPVPGCLLWGKESAEVDILIYVDGQEMFRIDNERLQKKGDQTTWNFTRSGGVWQQPQRVAK